MNLIVIFFISVLKWFAFLQVFTKSSLSTSVWIRFHTFLPTSTGITTHDLQVCSLGSIIDFVRTYENSLSYYSILLQRMKAQKNAHSLWPRFHFLMKTIFYIFSLKIPRWIKWIHQEKIAESELALATPRSRIKFQSSAHEDAANMKNPPSRGKTFLDYCYELKRVKPGKMRELFVLHAVSDYKKRSYKTQRWILGKI